MTVKSYLLQPIFYWRNLSVKFRVLLSALLMILVILAALPYGIKWGLKDALLKQGVEQVDIQDVSLNLFTGRFTVDNMLLKKAGQAPLKLGAFWVDFDWSALWDKRLVVEQMTLLNTDLSLRYQPGKQIDIAGIPIKLTPSRNQNNEKPLAWKLGLKRLVLKNTQVHLLMPDLHKVIKLNEVSLNDLQNWQPEIPASLSVRIEVGDNNQFGTLRGKLKLNAFSQAQKISGQLLFNHFLLQSYRQFLPPDIKELNVPLEGKVHLDAVIDHGKITAKLKSDLFVAKGGVQMSQLTANWHQIKLNGQSEILFAKSGLNVTSQTSLTLQGLQLNHQSQKLQADNLHWQGHAAFAQAPHMNWSANGGLNLTGWKISDPQQKLNLMAFKTLKTQFSVKSPQALSLKGFEVKQFEFAQLPEAQTKLLRRPIVTIHNLYLDHLNFVDAKQLTVGELSILGLEGSLDFGQDKQLPPLQAMQVSLKGLQPKHDDNKVEKRNNKPRQLSWSFAGVVLKGKNRVEILTHATDPNMHKVIQIDTLNIGKVDANHPKVPTPFKLQVKVDKFTKINSSGQVTPLTAKLNLQAKTQILDMDLFSFSPLIKRDLGYRIQSGSLNLNSDLDVKQNILASKNHVKLVGFEMVADDSAKSDQNIVSETANKTSELMSASALKFGLNMLRDSRDNIELDLPIKGDLSDPDFDVSSAVNVALRNALTGGTKLALTLALQPYGAIALVTSYAYDQVSKIVFQPVAFETGSVKLSKGMQNYLKKMAALLKQKTEISLKVCGYYTQRDKEKLQSQTSTVLTEVQLNQALYDLGKNRQTLVKDWLVNKGKIESSRLTTCLPALEKNSVTGVSLSM